MLLATDGGVGPGWAFLKFLFDKLNVPDDDLSSGTLDKESPVFAFVFVLTSN